MHVDVRAPRERVGERIDGWPGSVLENPAPRGQVISKIARGLRTPRKEHRQGRYGKENRQSGPRMVPRSILRSPLSGRTCVGVPEEAAVAASSRPLPGRTGHGNFPRVASGRRNSICGSHDGCSIRFCQPLCGAPFAPNAATRELFHGEVAELTGSGNPAERRTNQYDLSYYDLR